MLVLDYFSIVIFFITNLVIGILTGLKIKTVKEYSLGRKNFLPLTITLSLFASLIDFNSLTNVASEGYTNGFNFVYMPILVSINLIILGILSKRLNLRHQTANTVGQVIKQTFGKCPSYIVCLAGVIYSIVFVVIQFKGLGKLFEIYLGLDKNLMVWFTGITIAIYSAFGGVRSVTWTDLIKFFSTLVIIPLMLIIIVSNNSLVSFKFYEITNQKIYFDINYIYTNSPYLLVFLLPIFHPPIIQRILMFSNSNKVQGAFYINALMCFIFLFIIGLYGIVGNILYPNIDHNNIIFELFKNSVPFGLKGLVFCAIASIMISVADAYLNCAGVILYVDMLKELVPAKNLNDLISTKIITAFLAIIACAIANMDLDITKILVISYTFWAIVIAPFTISLMVKDINEYSFYISIIFAIALSIIFFKFLRISNNQYILISMIAFVFCSIVYILSNLIANKKELVK